ncbi:DNA repair protein RadA [candidate division WWE3 bacterium]|uniref:DNA repair protein RadA n=1 Tax=candidate division WWE3 bacterium TaxID=2053526 RepID=A0A955RXE2_UNCKA|nr:DNA repair protein RadA [candidate division WWE3 bacterium]
MAKNKITTFVCQSCGNESSRWSGRCFACGEWNTLTPVTIEDEPTTSSGYTPNQLELESLSDIKEKSVSRLQTAFDGLDRVLGGGLVPGSVILLGGEPGTGKSTLLLQYADAVASKGHVVYLSGEESVEQISMRANRLKLNNKSTIQLSTIATIDDFFHTIASVEKAPELVIIDSIQTVRDASSNARLGSLSHVQTVVQRMVEFAKRKRISVILVGHVTKEGSLAGPRTVEHMVDVVLYLEGETEKKVLRSVKNRFGSVNELALFSFENGFFEETIPSFLQESSEREPSQIGAVTTMIKEGGRFVPLEIQALVVNSYQQNPRRVINGYDFNRLLLLLAILDKHTKAAFYNHDVFVNVSEGIRINETAADLAICAALISSLKKIPIATTTAIWGEVSLLGKIMSVGHQEQRQKEAKRYGFEWFLSPAECTTISQALKKLGPASKTT